MRGFVLGALILTALDVALHSPANALTAAVATPTRWLAEWMDARTPLISAPATAQTQQSANQLVQKAVAQKLPTAGGIPGPGGAITAAPQFFDDLWQGIIHAF